MSALTQPTENDTPVAHRHRTVHSYINLILRELTVKGRDIHTKLKLRKGLNQTHKTKPNHSVAMYLSKPNTSIFSILTGYPRLDTPGLYPFNPQRLWY